jgi:hypothetical protein
MSSSFLNGKSSGGFGLPIPSVRVSGNPAPYPSTLTNSKATNDGTAWTWQSWAEVVALNIPEALLAPELELQIDLMRWIGEGRANQKGTPVSVGGGFSHPAHYDTSQPTRTGTDTHAGKFQNPNNFSRFTEWRITTRNQVVVPDFGGFFNHLDLAYRDLANNIKFRKMAVPTFVSRAGFARVPSTRMSYSRRCTPNYFTFRYAIKDVAKGKGFITGAMSDIVSALHHQQPFDFDPVTSRDVGENVCSLTPGFNDRLLKVMQEE